MEYPNSKYAGFMTEYEHIRNENLLRLEERREEIYQKIPRLREIAQEMASGAIRFAKGKLSGSFCEFEDLDEYLQALKEEQTALLLVNGYSEDSFEPIYTCKKCQDTGFVQGHPCSCLKQRMINTYYLQSNIQSILETENFQHFCLDYYSRQPDGIHSYTPYDNMKNILEQSKAFVADYDEKGGNLLFHGKTGLGKTYLSNCIAKALLDQGHTVLYLTAIRLFEDIMPDVVMNKKQNRQNPQIYNYVYSCDVLIIDDLGTEFVNDFTRSQVYQVINERLLAKKSTIISTNLSLKEIRNYYEERILARMVENYTIREFFGDNIRYLKKMQPKAGG